MKINGTASASKWAYKVKKKYECAEDVDEVTDNCVFSLFPKESWLKRRWQQLRTEYNSDSLHNPVLVKHLSFLKKCAKRADKVDDSIQIDHQIVGGDEFNVTQEQLDECMNETICTDANTINFDADNESNGSFAEYEFTIVADGSNDVVPHQTKNVNKTITIEKVVEDGRNSSERTASANLKIESPSIASKESPNTEVNEVEYQDKVFGDLVSAMLAKMTPEKKKQAKKEIMNILL